MQLYKYSNIWTTIGVNIGICFGNNQGNFHLHRSTTSENITKSFWGLLFLTHTVHSVVPLTHYRLSHTSMHHVSKVSATLAISSCHLLASY